IAQNRSVPRRRTYSGAMPKWRRTMHEDLSRRQFGQASAALAAGCVAASATRGDEPAKGRPGPRAQPPARTKKPRRRLAVVTTAYHYLSHAYHICGRFLHGYLRGPNMHYADWAIAGMYVDQPNRKDDLSRALAKEHGFAISKDVAAALTLGGDRLAVDGVLLIGE